MGRNKWRRLQVQLQNLEKQSKTGNRTKLTEIGENKWKQMKTDGK